MCSKTTGRPSERGRSVVRTRLHVGCLNALSHLFARPGEQCDIHQISADALAESLFALNLIGDFGGGAGSAGILVTLSLGREWIRQSKRGGLFEREATAD